MPPMSSQKKFFICLLIALMFHVLGLLISTLHIPKSKIEELEEQPKKEEIAEELKEFLQEKDKKQEKVTKSQDVAALKQRQSDLGISIIYTQDDDDDKPLAAQATPAEIQEEQQEENIHTEETPMPVKPREELKVEAISSTIQQDKPQEQVKIFAPKRTRKRRKKADTGTSTLKDRPIIPNLAAGFVQHMRNEGNDWLSRKGNENIRPDQEEMRRLSYVRKVIWFLQQANKLTASRLDDILKNYILKHRNGMLQTPETLVAFAIGKKGNIEDISIVTSSGIPNYDQYVIDTFYKAAPFPPVPNYLGTTFRHRILIYAEPTMPGKPRFSFGV